MAAAAVVVGAGIAAMAAAVGAAALWVESCSFASFRPFFRIRICSCMELTNRPILGSVCSSRIFSIRRVAATTSSIVRWPSFCTSIARFLSKAPKKASTACRSAASSSFGWSLLANFSASPASSTMSFVPFLRPFSAAQASSFTDPMPKRVRRASLAFSQVAASPRLDRMPDPVMPMRSWHHVILLVSSSTSPS